jgi:two-component system, NtrC family, response regulator PilR
MAKKKILCVEDHPDICELVSAVLNEFEVISANSVAEAMQKAAKGKFSLYLLDYHLPDGTGVDLTQSIRNFDDATPILFFTATSSMNEPKALKIGAQGFVRKATDSFIEDLMNTVTRLVSA